MGKKLTKAIDRERTVSRLKWEFFRRNKEYINDFAKIVPNASKVLISESLPKNGKAFFEEKYGIFYPINPKWSYGELMAKTRNNPRDLLMPIGLTLMQISSFKLKHNKLGSLSDPVSSHILGNDRIQMVRGFDGKRRLMQFFERFVKRNKEPYWNYYYKVLTPRAVDMSRIILDINLNFPKKHILKTVADEIGVWKDLYDKSHKNARRERFENYLQYLKIYDHREFLHQTWVEIAKKFYKNDSENDLSYAKRKVKRDYNRCLKLIRGDFRQIR